MARSRVCPHCGRLNSSDQVRCFSCGKGFPGPLRKSLRELWGTDFLATRGLALLVSGVFGLSVLDHGSLPIGLQLGGLDTGGAFRASALLRWGALLGDLGFAEPFRRLAAVFVHFGLIHWGLNLLALIDFGRRAEQRLGGARYLVLFAVSGGAGFWVSDLWYAASVGGSPLTAGASGSLFGLVGAEIGWLYARRDPAFKETLLRALAYALIFALMLPVNNAAHAGGFLVGALGGWALERLRPSPGRDRAFLLFASLTFFSIVASLVLSQRSPVWHEVRRFELEQQGRGGLEF